jgi:hypothetical protein
MHHVETAANESGNLRLLEHGQASRVEHCRLPDVFHQRIIRADDFVAAIAGAGFNQQQVCWSIIVFVF